MGKDHDRTYSGPKEAICAVCGLVISAYESRYYGNDGAIHVWTPDGMAHAKCRTNQNTQQYPWYYTGG